MIAHIYPLKRMPRAVSVFDYAIPEALESSCRRGQLVVIPFRQSMMHGIVARVSDKPLRGIQLKSVLSVDPRIVLSDSELSFFESLAHELAQSVPSLLNSVLPTLPKRTTTPRPLLKGGGGIESASSRGLSLTIPESESADLIRIAHQLAERHRAFAHLTDIKRMAATISFYLREKPNQKCVVLAPTVVDAERLHAHLSTFSPLLFTATQNQNQQFNAWTTFRLRKTGMIIGTKNVLLATDAKTTTIFVIRSSSPHHGHHEQNPRFDARMIAEQFAREWNVNLFSLDAIPRIDDLHELSDANILGQSPHQSVQLVDMEQEYRASAIGGFVSLAVCETIREAIKNRTRVLCVLNKKTRVNRLRCVTCKTNASCDTCHSAYIVDEHVMRCLRCHRSESRAQTCVRCGTKTLEEFASGNKKMAEVLQKEFPDAVFCSIDKEHPTVDPSAHIVLATSFYLESPFNPFTPDRWGAVILLDADEPLYRPTHRAVEDAVTQLEQWNAVAFGSRASIIAQTHTRSLFQEYLDDPLRFLKNELALRETYNQPPFHRIALLQVKESEPRRADVKIEECKKQIRQALPVVGIQRIPSMKPNVHLLEIRFNETEKAALLDLFARFPDDVIIDMQADSR